MQFQQTIRSIVAMFFLLLAIVSASAQQTWRVGDQVEAKHTNNWYKATIIEVRNGQYKVHYDGYDNSYDLWKTAADVRPRSNAGAQNNQNTAARGNTLPVGGWVLANLGTPVWRPAILLEVTQGQYKVQIHGEAPGSHYLVPASRIRPMPPQSIPATEAGFFFGNWALSIWGGVTYAAAKAPPLTIKSDGTYEWIVPANGGRKVLTGKWRTPTKTEWRYDQVAIVLLNGVDGKNWIVRENITYCTPKFVGDNDSSCTPDKVRDKIKLWDGDINYDGTRMK